MMKVKVYRFFSASFLAQISIQGAKEDINNSNEMYQK